MQQFSLSIPMTPVPKGRPRLGKSGVYTPERTKIAEQTVAWAITSAKPQKFVGPVTVSIVFMFKRPKTAPLSVRHHTKKPDLDNLAKLILDASNGFLWEDDCQVACLKLEKIYADVDGIFLEVCSLA